MYTFCNLFLSCSAFSVRLALALNTSTEISSNPEKDKQPTWERTNAFYHVSNTLLYFYISIPYMKYLVHIYFIVDMTLSIFSFFLNIRVSTPHIHTQRGILNRFVLSTNTHAHIQRNIQHTILDYLLCFLFPVFLDI